MRTLTGLFCLFLLASCMGADKANMDSGAFAADTGALDDTEPDTADDDTALDAIVPSWWALDTQILLTEGVPQAETLSISFFGERGREEGALCIITAPVESLTAMEDLPHETIYHWWQVHLLEPVEGCDVNAPTAPASFQLGLGALHDDIAALLDPFGYGALAGSLYGAYISLDEGASLWAFGVAATDAGYDGESVVVDASPVPDGSYRFKSFYLLPL